jgi:hypothetical protein
MVIWCSGIELRDKMLEELRNSTDLGQRPVHDDLVYLLVPSFATFLASDMLRHGIENPSNITCRHV